MANKGKAMQGLIDEYLASTSDAVEKVLAASRELTRFDDANIDLDKHRELMEFAGLAAYQGFDPKMIAYLLLSKRKEKEVERDLDIEKMIIIAIERGNNLASIKKNSTVRFTAEVNRLVSVYDVKAKAGNSRSNITFSRVSMAFPDVTCSYMPFAKSTTVPLSVMNSISKEYPVQMMTSAFGSMIPLVEPISTSLRHAYYIHQYEFTKIVSQKDPSAHSVMVSDVIKYTDAAMKGSILNEETKIELLKKWDLLMSKNKLTVSNAVRNAEAVWKDDYMNRED